MPTDAKILTALIKKFFIKTILYKCIIALERCIATRRVATLVTVGFSPRNKRNYSPYRFSRFSSRAPFRGAAGKAYSSIKNDSFILSRRLKPPVIEMPSLRDYSGLTSAVAAATYHLSASIEETTLRRTNQLCTGKLRSSV